MAVRSDIKKTQDWFRYEGKSFAIIVTNDSGANVNLANTNLAWRVSRAQGSNSVYLLKTTSSGLTIGGVNNHVVTVTVLDSDYNSLPAGPHYHELWDVTNDLLLTYGDAYLRPSRGHA